MHPKTSDVFGRLRTFSEDFGLLRESSEMILLSSKIKKKKSGQAAVQCSNQLQNRPSPPGQTPGHLTFLRNFGQIPHYVASLDSQMGSASV